MSKIFWWCQNEAQEKSVQHDNELMKWVLAVVSKKCRLIKSDSNSYLFWHRLIKSTARSVAKPFLWILFFFFFYLLQTCRKFSLGSIMLNGEHSVFNSLNCSSSLIITIRYHSWQQLGAEMRKIVFQGYWDLDHVCNAGLPVSSCWNEALLSLV